MAHSPPDSDERNADVIHAVFVWFVMIITINIHYSPLSIINWLMFVMETLCAFCNVEANFKIWFRSEVDKFATELGNTGDRGGTVVKVL